MASSPTSRTLAECKALGLTAQVVEKWNAYARIRVDLFDAIDVVACGEGYILGIQACAGGSHSKRLAKAVASPRIAAWIAGGGIFEVWSWSKRGGRGKRKVWTCRKERVTEIGEEAYLSRDVTPPRVRSRSAACRRETR